MIPPTIMTVEEKTADEVVVLLATPPDHPAFAGHFPDHPVLPGVVQVDWAVRLGDTYLGTRQPVATSFQVKFNRLVEPGEASVLRLRLRLDRAKGALVFGYSTSDGAAVSSGRIKLTGVP